MAKKSPLPITAFRLTPDDEHQIKFIQEKLSAPGMQITKTDVLRRALHAFANELRSQGQERRKGDSSKAS
jgi:hypothetical protein